jgi:hypothetical protein
MFDIEPIDALALSLHHNPGVYALLVGSGLSRAAGIPTGWEITLDLIRKVGALAGVENQSNWAAWYQERYGVEPSYSELLDKLATTPSERRAVLHGYIEPQEAEETRRPTKAHHAIAKLVADGVVRVIITTNFDRLLENALREAGVEPTVISGEDAVSGATPLVHSRCTVIKLHGDYLDMRIKNTDEELGNYAPAVDRLLDEVFDRFGLVVVGWSGEWDTALRAALQRAPSRRYPLYWSARGEVRQLGKDLISLRDGRIILISDADAFFGRLGNAIEALGQSERPHPFSAQMAVALAKRYCRDDRYVMEWVELLTAEVGKIRAFMTGADYPATPPTNDAFNAVVESLVARSEILRRMCMVCARWGTDGANKAVAHAISALTSWPRAGGYEIWLELRPFPATLCLYSSLLGALAAENFQRVRLLMHAPVRQENHQSTLVSDLPPTALGKIDWKVLRDFQNKRTPASDLLVSILGREAHDIALLPDEADELFDRVELLVSLEFAYLRLQRVASTGIWFWCPTGRYIWKAQRQPNTLDDYETLPESDSRLRAGLLGGKPGSAKATVTAIRDFLKKVGSW